MQNDEFEWDDAKAAMNIAKHGVSFQEATRVFDDPNAIEMFDDDFDHGEDRWIISGLVNGKLLIVIYTERHGRIRLISARHGDKNDYDDYFRPTQKE